MTEIYASPPEKKYADNKIDIYYIHDTCSMDLRDINDYGPKNNKCFRLILVAIDTFSKFRWTVPLKKTFRIKDSF